jgi:protein-S-isoprenylcysteine O-methyltransferase Ste14
MNSELTFRVLFLVLFIMWHAIRVYYALKGRTPGQKRSSRERWQEAVQHEGKAFTILWSIHNTYWFVAIVLYLISPAWMVWARLPIPDWVRWVGVGLAVTSLPFLLWAHHTLGKQWSKLLELKRKHKLVTSGPYSWVRHPIYTHWLTINAALIMVSANLLLLIFYPFSIILIYARIGNEERMLLKQFGEEYRAYMKRTGRLLPRFHRETRREKRSFRPS